MWRATYYQAKRVRGTRDRSPLMRLNLELGYLVPQNPYSIWATAPFIASLILAGKIFQNCKGGKKKFSPFRKAGLVGLPQGHKALDTVI